MEYSCKISFYIMIAEKISGFKADYSKAPGALYEPSLISPVPLHHNLG